jgi:hypothetical protein
LPATDSLLAGEKIAHAVSLLDTFDLDLWLTFVHETSLVRDPALDLICPFDLTWHSALMVHRSGESVAIVGRYDAANLERLHAYTRVVNYDQSVRPALVEQLRAWRPETVALNFSRNDPASSGLTTENLRRAGVLSTRSSQPKPSGEPARPKDAPRDERLVPAVASTDALIDELTPHVRAGRSGAPAGGGPHTRMRSSACRRPGWDRIRPSTRAPIRRWVTPA